MVSEERRKGGREKRGEEKGERKSQRYDFDIEETSITYKGVDYYFPVKNKKYVLSGLTWGMIAIPVVWRDKQNDCNKKRLRLKRPIR